MTSDLKESRAHQVIVTEATAEKVECSRHLEGGPVRVAYSHTQKTFAGGDFPGGPMAKTLNSQCKGAQVQSPVQKLDRTDHNQDPALRNKF